MITTNTGNFTSLPLSKGGVFVKFETLKPAIKFVPFSKLNNTIRKPDFANTLYWGLFKSNSISKQITFKAPNNIAGYEIYIVSLSDSLKILRHNKIKVNNKPNNGLNYALNKLTKLFGVNYSNFTFLVTFDVSSYYYV